MHPEWLSLLADHFSHAKQAGRQIGALGRAQHLSSFFDPPPLQFSMAFGPGWAPEFSLFQPSLSTEADTADDVEGQSGDRSSETGAEASGLGEGEQASGQGSTAGSAAHACLEGTWFDQDAATMLALLPAR